jgi:3-oxoacyl-(acyl-carrier-protein) synthase
MEQRALITGMCTVKPIGIDAPSSCEALVAGRSGIDTITAFDT